ncbi:putative colanic acid biosynthesis acetyltransferase [Methylomarinovum caldicuralii]|uniref:putative colanic acid biosynthesis acetyltransferase n=1 Tax=Methylomarinovum caldicuralii TaxID=438856 RepID=UPI002954A058|nr:putative colanic acid biosynthesis acetyltransferase [Methylomarinovum caldicuralii]
MHPEFQNLGLFRLPSGFRGRPGWYVQIWWIVQSTLFAMSPQFMYGWRRFLLRLFGAEIGDRVLIRPSVRVTYPWKVKIGDRSWVGDHVEIYSLGEIEIGRDVVISQRSYLCSATHDYKKVSFDMIANKIKIEDQAWIATDVFIAPGVKIGRGALIGARSSVFSEMPEGMICFGCPARPVKPRLRQSQT